MPWHIAEEHSQCPTSRPFAVVKTGDGTVEGCHGSREEANDQLAALYANEPTLTRANGEEPNLDTPDAGDLNTAARRIAAERGWAMDDRAYPIRPADQHGAADLDKAIRAVGRGGASHNAIRRHIIKRARAIGQAERIPDNWGSDGSLRGERMMTAASPIEHRDAQVAEVNFPQRLITTIMVPWDEPTEVFYRGEWWNELFKRGAFDGIEKRPNRVRANREHMKLHAVGKAVKLWPSRDEGLVGEFRIAQTPLGEETLALAYDEALSASVGFGVMQGGERRDRNSMSRVITKAYLDHLAFVQTPAYENAKVLAVRDQIERDNRGPVMTPNLDSAMADELIRWAAERCNN